MPRQVVILGTPVVLPDPASVTALAAEFQQQGGQLADLETTVQALSKPDAWEDWTGLAADEFGRSVGQLPAELGDVRDAYEGVASALQQYAGELEPVVNSLTSLSYQAEDAEGTLSAVRNARSQAITNGQDPASTGWDARLADASDAVSALGGQLNRLLDELTALAAMCTRHIKAAEPKAAGKSLFGEIERDVERDVVDPLVHSGKEAVKLAEDLVKLETEAGRLELFGTVAMVEGSIHLVTRLWQDAEHLDAEQWGQVLGDVATVLGIVALLPIPGVDVVAGLASFAFGGAAALADWVALKHHENGASVMQASLATVGFALTGVGMVAKAGADAAKAGTAAEDLDDGADAVKSGQNLWETGFQRTFTPSGIKDTIEDDLPRAPTGPRSFGQALVSNVKDEYVFPAAKTYSGPAAVTIARIGWTADRLNDTMTAEPYVAGAARYVARAVRDIEGLETESVVS